MLTNLFHFVNVLCILVKVTVKTVTILEQLYFSVNTSSIPTRHSQIDFSECFVYFDNSIIKSILFSEKQNKKQKPASTWVDKV